ncbi:hypothetical protein DOTSEDRAFT_132297, partial [Dothistroma septosporum NZE10]
RTNRGSRYFISFIDNYSRYIEVDIIKSKSKAFRSFCAYKQRTENSTSNSVVNNERPRLKVLKSDNALEFLTEEFEKLLEDSSIIRELSAPYCPEQNAIIERPNRTIMSKVRALLYEANLPKYLWGEAVLVAVFIYNYTLHASLGFKTPYELRYRTKPDLNNIKIFGSIAYYRNPSPKKLETRVNKAILLGYTDYSNYKLLDLNSHKIIFARDVKILEGAYLDKPSISLSNIAEASLRIVVVDRV